MQIPEGFKPAACGAMQLSRVAFASAKAEGSRLEVASNDLFFWSCAFVLIEHQINSHVTEGRLVQKPFLHSGNDHYCYWGSRTAFHTSLKPQLKTGFAAKLHEVQSCRYCRHPLCVVLARAKPKAMCRCVMPSSRWGLPGHELHQPL